MTQLLPLETDHCDMLSFQKLRVYQRSIDFLALVMTILEELPKGHAELADHYEDDLSVQVQGGVDVHVQVKVNVK